MMNDLEGKRGNTKTNNGLALGSTLKDLLNGTKKGIRAGSNYIERV